MLAYSGYRMLDIEQGYQDLSECLLVNCTGYYETEEPFGATHRLNGRKDWYLSFNKSGLMKCKHNGCIFEIPEKTVFIYKPGEEQYYGQATDNSIENYWVHFTGSGVESLIASLGLDSGIFKVNIDLSEPFEKMISDLRQKAFGYTFSSAAWLTIILTLVARSVQKLDTGEIPDKRYEQIAPTIQYIRENYRNKISIKELADLVHFSVSHYCNIFRETVKMSPQQYIIKYRLEKASELLVETKLTISEISFLTGFQDQLYFSKKFRDLFEVTPSGFRKLNTSTHTLPHPSDFQKTNSI